ncbi:DUF262 domain-containing protein [Mucilaginibacter kameinonensis]|uniref:DUF262 domain-containing protein n=1 Tax=Mucilaginibacter kameinonensis TaxID=452286 RepID=UPI000EF76316|nr:DUF262 domain-containing protein [Mucilaginibacter kameinonensis]
MQTGQTTVRGIFDGSRIFNVPIYQRAYSWEKDNHLPYFFNDLVNQQADRPYFLGTFLFHECGRSADFEVIDIIDGQQRLTTMIIFMNVLIRVMQAAGSALASDRTYRIFIRDGDTYKLELSNEDTAFLHQYILGKDDPLDEEINTPSKRLLLEAKGYFNNKLKDLQAEQLDKLYITLTEAEALLYTVKQISSATQIFELLNDRGKKLTDLESIKSFLMYNMGLVAANPDQYIKNIQQHFADIYRLIELYAIDDNDVLRYHTIAFEKEFEERPKKFIKRKISKLINAGKKEEAKLVIERYTKSLLQSFQLFRSIKDNTVKEPLLDNLFMIGKVGPYYPVMMKVLKEQPADFNRLLQELTNFTFKASMSNLRSSGESYFHTDLRNGQDVIRKIMLFSRDNWWNINGRVKASLAYANYYEWLNNNLVKYILFSYENHRREKIGFPLLSRSDYHSDDNRKKLNIEHITAKKAKGIVFDDDFKENYLHHIGNLVIDSTASNSSKNNSATGDKLEHFQRAPIMSQNEIDRETIDWTDLEAVKKFITDRGQVLKTFIVEEILKEGDEFAYYLPAPTATVNPNS